MLALRLDTLDQLPEEVSRPNYRREDLAPGIVHIGLGNFHRAHQAWYLHRLFQMGESLDWAIIGAGVRAYDAEMRAKMIAQDCLTTLIELDPAGTSAEVTGAMIDYVPVEEGNGPLIRQMADPAIRIVALTVTEGGYFLGPATGEFDPTHPDIAHDVAHPETPKTAFGAMIAALRIRRDNGVGPFTGLSCDNLQGNGGVLKNTVISMARLSDPRLADWIEANCTFPNSMVDCIVPATGPGELEMVRALGIDDKVPVTHENYRQWVIEDNFCAGRPDWDKAGVTFSDRVHDFETMKIRILNGGHQVIANPGEILSVGTISGAMEHPLIRPFFCKVVTGEIVPHVGAVPGMMPLDYVDLIVERFSNPWIVDTTRRVAFDGSSRHAGFILPVVREALAAGTPIEGLALVEAHWARYCTGIREDGSAVEPNDPIWEELVERAEAARDDPGEWLKLQAYAEVAEDARFAEAFERWLRMIHAEGTEAAMRAYLVG